MEEKMKQLKKLLEESSHVAAYVGAEMVVECGYNLFTVDDDIYDAEAQYGYALENLRSARFYETRAAQFFEYYRNEIIQHHMPGIGFLALAKLQRMGKLKSVVSNDIYMLAKRAGCKNTIELSGNIFDNSCQKCGKKYPLNAIRKNDKVPLCRNCKVKIRPNVLLEGETRDNMLMTKAANAIEQADVLLLLGSHIMDDEERELLRYYEGNKLVVINSELKGTDDRADLYIQGRVCDILPRTVDLLT